jgi:two-component system cell cycle response regulator DivK
MPARILIADDFDDNRELLRLMLESAGYRVRETRDGRECVEAARAEEFDIALVDLSMPVLDGWGALAELRADERTRELPCVAVTAFAAEQDRQRALAAGFDAYVSKPYRQKDLLEVIEHILGPDGHARGGNSPDARRTHHVGHHDAGDHRPAPATPRPAPAFAGEDADG